MADNLDRLLLPHPVAVQHVLDAVHDPAEYGEVHVVTRPALVWLGRVGGDAHLVCAGHGAHDVTRHGRHVADNVVFLQELPPTKQA